MNFPELEYFYPMIRQSLDQAEAGQGGALLTQSAREALFEAALFRIGQSVSGYFQQRDGETNPPARITENVGILLRHFSDFVAGMLRDLSDYRDGICKTLFGGKTYTRITGLEMKGLAHDSGKAAAVTETDAGTFVYKPRSCRADAAAYRFMEKHFGEIIRMPKVFAAEDRFGAVEFLEKKRAEGPVKASAYYYALGGTAAVIRMLGSSDMHTKNLFACEDKIALIDTETLLSPCKKISGKERLPFLTEEDQAYLRDSLISSCLSAEGIIRDRPEEPASILINKGELGSAPVIDGKRESVLLHKEEFFKGFSEYYDRCLNRREALKKDVRDFFSGCFFRCFVHNNSNYRDILKKLNSRYSYELDIYYRIQLSMLPAILHRDSGETTPEIYAQETEALMRQEIPYFCTYGGSRDLYGSGRIVCRDYFRESCVERCLRILSGMQESEKQFEMQVIRCYLDQAHVPAEDMARIRPLELADAPLSQTAAMEEAEKILLEIRQRAIPLASGELAWLDYMPEKVHSDIMAPGFYSGLAGLAVFFAAIGRLSKNEEVKRTAKECLETSMRSLRRFLDSHAPAEPGRMKYFDSGDGAGAAGLLRGLVLVNRYQDHRYNGLLEAAVSQCLEPDCFRTGKAEKAGGIADLLCTLCQYEELYEKREVPELIETLAVHLIRLKTKTEMNHSISGTEYDECVIAQALLLADKRLGTERFAQGARDALAKMSGGSGYGPSRTGVIFERLQKDGITDSGLARKRTRASSDAGQIRDSGLDDLYRGNMSTVEYHLEAGDIEAAGRLLSAILARKEAMGDYHLGYEDCITNHNVTLFFGLAGIGYEFLRYAEPGRTESVV